MLRGSDNAGDWLSWRSFWGGLQHTRHQAPCPRQAWVPPFAILVVCSTKLYLLICASNISHSLESHPFQRVLAGDGTPKP